VVDCAADQADRDGCAAALLDRGSQGACGRSAMAGRSGKELGEIITVAQAAQGCGVTAHRPDEAARRSTGRPRFIAMPRHDLSRPQAPVPRPQRAHRAAARRCIDIEPKLHRNCIDIAPRLHQGGRAAYRARTHLPLKMSLP
jgi:hypothetical protein